MNALLLLGTLLSSTGAFAAETALLKVTRGSGFVPKEWSYSSKCDVGSEHTLNVVTKAGEPADQTYRNTVYTKALPNTAAVRVALVQASQAALEHSQGPTDGPSEVYLGIIQGDVVDQHVRLKQFSGGGNNYRNTARELDDLVEFGNQNCPYVSRE